MLIKDIYILKGSNPVEISENENITINLELDKAPIQENTLLTGNVSSNGKPISNATVVVLDKSSNQMFHTATDENGMYQFCSVLSVGKYKVIASAIGYMTSGVVTVCIKENEVIQQSFELERSIIYENGIVYGKILENCSKKPIDDAKIYLKSIDDIDHVFYFTTSNHNGQFLIYNVLPDIYIIEVKKQGYIFTKPLEITVEKFDRISLYFDLIKENASSNNTISGFVTSNTKAVIEAVVILYRLDEFACEKVIQIQKTNECGFYFFANIDKGSYLVKAKLQNDVIYEEQFIVS